MEIDKNQGIQMNAYVNNLNDKNKADATGAKAETTPVKTDTVVISDAAKQVQEFTAQLDKMPDVREDKVAELKKQVENGTYEIRADETAEKLLKDHLSTEVLK